MKLAFQMRFGRLWSTAQSGKKLISALMGIPGYEGIQSLVEDVIVFKVRPKFQSATESGTEGFGLSMLVLEGYQTGILARTAWIVNVDIVVVFLEIIGSHYTDPRRGDRWWPFGIFWTIEMGFHHLWGKFGVVHNLNAVDEILTLWTAEWIDTTVIHRAELSWISLQARPSMAQILWIQSTNWLLPNSLAS